MAANINYQPEDCLRCNTTGIDRFPNAQGEHGQCAGCGGKGSVLVAQPARKCANCHETGEVLDVRQKPMRCPVCAGTTWVHRYVPPRS